MSVVTATSVSGLRATSTVPGNSDELTAHCARNRELAAELIRRADLPEIRRVWQGSAHLAEALSPIETATARDYLQPIKGIEPNVCLG